VTQDDIDGDDDLYAASNTDLMNVHSPKLCAGRACVLHNPSDHSMRSFPLTWRDDGRFMERTCPHGIGHPDPDDAAYRRSINQSIGVHGCDGCCRG
jgi:hypothetical protein